MDLVDIDKVLDSLELNEEEHIDVNSLIKPLEILGSDVLRRSDLIPPDDSASIDEPASVKTTPTATNSQVGERFINKFVGVSQVFSSLDDYRKNIETLQVGIDQCKNNKSYEGSNDIRHAIVDKESDALVDAKVDDLCEDDEINKFVNIEEEVGISSNSITTSSSSSFSSGPSSALLSSESELSLDAVVSDQSVLLSQKYNHTIEVDNNLQSIESKNKINCDNEPNRSEFDDLAVGLSSISLTNEASLLHSEISSKYNLKTEFLSSNNDRDENKHNSKVVNTESMGLDKNYTMPQLVSNQNVMVTFGSTMDEISDTELDSILQEIDSEMPSQSCLEAVSLDGPKDTMKKDEGDIQSKDNLLNKDNMSMVENFPPKITFDSTSDDVINVDSFSQASTIEFAEDRTQEGEIDSSKDIEEVCDADSEELKNENQNGQKRQRPTTLDLPIRKINLYASAGQTPPGSRIYDQNTSSSEEDSPGDKADRERDFNDAAGHTPPERSDRSIASVNEKQTEIANSILNQDEPMTVSENIEVENEVNQESQGSEVNPNLGKVPPIWVPDNEANSCMQCQHKFTLLKRRHHCRACGQVLCSVCCSQKFKLEFLSNPESRVCVQCFLILSKFQQHMEQQTNNITTHSPSVLRTPNPNNPMEYCSTIPPYRQVNPQAILNPTVIVPVGVLKKEGNHKKSRKRKSVMFSDGIRPGSDLANLDGKWSDAKHARKSVSSASFATNPGTSKGENILSPINVSNKSDREANLDGNWSDAKHTCKSIPSTGCAHNSTSSKIIARNASSSVALPDGNNSFMFKDENTLPPIYAIDKSDKVYQEVPNNANLIKRLHSETLKFVVQTNFYVFVKISHLKCCINKTVINFTTCGLHHVGNDEIMILLELDNSNEIPKDIFIHLNDIYVEASKGHPISELGFSMPRNLLFLGSREHGGFLFIRSTFQCLQDVQVPDAPFLIGVLIHRWEVPWAKIFPLRLMLRLGAQYRYYPSPHISVRKRAPVYIDIAQTIINLLADFRNYSYTIPTIKGMYIHMEDRRTNILIPRNRHEDVIKAIKNSSDHILAIGANFSKKADGHLVCIQNIKTDSTDLHSYSTQAINIQGQPRKVTGASFFILNEALKTSSGLSGKCSIIEDGLMVQILPSKMIEIRNALNNMKDVNIVCGPIEASEQHTEVVYIQWVEDDVEINIGVKSPIDSKELDGIPSIRIHSGVKLSNGNHNLKWTEVFIIKISGNVEFPQCRPAVDITKVSESIAKSASIALLPFLDLLAANGNIKIGLRVTINQDKVGYEAGSQSEKLPPLYMNALDNELIPTLHTQANEIDTIIVLELIFHILNL